MSENQNPLMSKVKLPGRIFQLPSRGIYYRNGELESNVQNGEVHIHPMSALAEIHMKNPDQLFSGQAVETVFRECVGGVLKPSELLSKDVDAIMMFLRTVTYGPSYEFTAKHDCENAKEHSYVADVDSMIGKMEYIDPTTITNIGSVTLPNGQIVRLQPTRYSQVVSLMKANEGKTEVTVQDTQNNLILMLKSAVVQVDDTVDSAFIEEWLRTITTTWVTRIAEKMEALNQWGPQLKWTAKCKDCGKSFDVDLPINPVAFFIE